MKIFVASTGRCGTVFMAQMFHHMTDIPSFHEPLPRVFGHAMMDINNNKVDLKKKTILELQQKIQNITADSRNGDYFESSNFFIRSFALAVLEAFDDVYCIYLHRNPLDLIASFAHRYKHYGHRRGFILEPDLKRNLLRTEPGMDYFETVMWNYFEIRARYFALKDRFVKSFDFDFRQINNLDEWYRLFDHFGIKAKKIACIPNDLKKNPSPNLTLAEAGDIIRNYRRG